MKTSSYINWCNENEGRGYPIAEHTTRVSDSGQTLPNDILADLGILVPVDYAGLRVSTVYLSAYLVSVSISADAGGLLTGTFQRNTTRPYTAYALTPLIDDVSGWVVFGNHQFTVPEHYRFATAAQAAIETRCVRVIPPPGVKRFQRIGNAATVYAANLVKLTGGPQFVIEQDSDNAQNIIVRLGNDVKDRFTEPCTRPASSDACGVPPVRRLNNVQADENGVITLRFE